LVVVKRGKEICEKRSRRGRNMLRQELKGRKKE
jgi:hypothetical protein